MESRTLSVGNIFKYIVILLIAGGAFMIVRHFTNAPSDPNREINKADMSMFMKNTIMDVDRKLKAGVEGENVANWVSFQKSSTALYYDAKNADDQKIREQSNQLKNLMVQMQTKQFPYFREAYVDATKSALSTENIRISASGKSNEVLTVTGSAFKPEKTKKKFLRGINDITKDLRFKEVIFKWSDRNEDYASYHIDSKNDGEI